MKPLIYLFIVIASFALVTSAKPPVAKTLTKEEREAAIKYLKQTQKMFLDSVKGLSEEQLKWKAAPDKWSVFEVAEHITLAESFLFDFISQQAMKSPADASKTSTATPELIMQKVPDRSRKFQAPEPIQPSKATWGSLADTLKAFKERRQTTIDFVAKGNDDMREHFAPNPLLGDMDAYLWIFFLSGHTERHVKQIIEVKENPNFPQK